MEKPDFIDRVCDLLAYRFDQYVDRWQVIFALIVAFCILALSLGIYVKGCVSTDPKVIQTTSSPNGAPQGDKNQSPNSIFVYICGAVNNPGVYRIGAGARINAVVALAGGLTNEADALSINLAKKLIDGERIYIPRVDERAKSGPDAGAEQSISAWNADGKLNLNMATADDLDKLPGVGPVFAARILDYRQKQNGFTDIAQMRNIEGIGPKTYAKLKPLVYVE